MLNGLQPLTAGTPEPMPVPAGPAVLQTSPPGDPGHVAVPGGAPDVEVAIKEAMVRVFAVFQVDPETNEMHVSVVDDAGRLVRLIPPDSVAQMISEMAAYSRRHSR